MVQFADRTRRGFLSLLGAVSLGSVTASAQVPSASHPVPNSEYLLAPGLTYLNTGSLGPTPRTVLERTLQAWYELESNPVGMMWGHGAVIDETDKVRALAAQFLGCATEELLVTHSTTDGMNSVALGMNWSAGDRVLTTDQEHEGGSLCWSHVTKRSGGFVDKIAITPADQDMNAIVQRFAAAITPQTRVISVSHVLTTTGLRMPIPEIAALARQRGILCVVDGAQAVAQIPVDVKALGCHAYAANGHKWLLGPKGTGLLYISRDAANLIQPIQLIEGNRCVTGSTGAASLPLIVGLGAAVELMKARGMESVESHNLALRNRAYAGLMKIPRIKLVSPPPGANATALVAFMLPPEVDSIALRMRMHDKYKVVVKQEEKQWFNGIRLSPHIFNTEDDIDRTLSALRAEIG
jgi:selenocysteine lyase/cysteine desulfurase